MLINIDKKTKEMSININNKEEFNAFKSIIEFYHFNALPDVEYDANTGLTEYFYGGDDRLCLAIMEAMGIKK